MRLRWWAHDNEGLERARRADAQADAVLFEARVTARWAENALARNGFAEALITIMRGETP